ncbi:hypothetical protein EJ03DRAFT_46906 [Teratosphaeria nubilosa]|uniref:Uncharacterized protein n=1 Tax=Teratosphaeria nubilosa TaxID=161662 RepID=A0A6G1LE91_9PEZI|nr:hypothetical protein EJ03DRAFT_46906 [Teratosphaeria nubilosa]
MSPDANGSSNRLSKWLDAIKGFHEKKASESKNAQSGEGSVPCRRASHSSIAEPQLQRTAVLGQRSRPTLQRKATNLDAVKSGGGSVDMHPGYFRPSGELKQQDGTRSEQQRPRLKRKTTYLDAVQGAGGFSYGGGGTFDVHPGHLAPSGELYQRYSERDVALPQTSGSKASQPEQINPRSHPHGRQRQRRASVCGLTTTAAAPSETGTTRTEHKKSTRRKSISTSLPPGHYIHPVTKRLIPPHPNSNFVKLDRHRWPRERYVDHINYTKMYPETVWCGGKDSVAPKTQQNVPTATPDSSPKKPGFLKRRRESVSAISPKTVAAAAMEKIIGGSIRGRSRSVSGAPVPHPVYPSQRYYPTGQESEIYKKQLRRQSALDPAEPAVPRPLRMPPSHAHEPNRDRASSRSRSRVQSSSVSRPEGVALSRYSTSTASVYSGQPFSRQVAHTGTSASPSRHDMCVSSESRGDVDYSNPRTGSGVSLPRAHTRRSHPHHIPGTSGSSTTTSTGSTSQGWGAAYSNGSMLPAATKYSMHEPLPGHRRAESRSRSVSRGRSHSVSGTSGRRDHTSEAFREAERLVRVHEGSW